MEDVVDVDSGSVLFFILLLLSYGSFGCTWIIIITVFGVSTFSFSFLVSFG